MEGSVEEYTTFVPGVVRPQGSLSLFRDKTGREVAKHSDKTVLWRQTMHGHFAKWWEGRVSIAGPVKVTLLATFTRPKWHLGSGRNAGVVKPSAPLWHTSYPDSDKIARAVGDSLVDAGVLVDDCQISEWSIRKTWCPVGERPGALVTVEVL